MGAQNTNCTMKFIDIRQRVWVETRPRLGRDTSASGARHVRIWDMVRPHLGRGSLTGIEDGLANCFFGSTRLWEEQKRAGMFGDWQGGDALELGKGLRPRWVGCSKSRKISVRF